MKLKKPMEPIGVGAQDDCAKLWMLVEKCGEKREELCFRRPDVFILL